MLSQAVADLSDTELDACVADGITLVDVCAPWCSECHTQDRILDKVAEAVRDRATVARVDVDESSIRARLGVHAIPALLVFRDGEEVKRLVGVQRGEDLVALLEWYAARPPDSSR